MNKYDHLPLIVYKGEIQRQTRSGGGGYKALDEREKSRYSIEIKKKAEDILDSFKGIKKSFRGITNPSLIFEIEVNQSVDPAAIERLLVSMGIHILSISENKKGYWVVFSDDENLKEFKRKLNEYGLPTGHNYDFFNAFGNIRDIPRDKKIGKRLLEKPLTAAAEVVDIEVWRFEDEKKVLSFIENLNSIYSNQNEFRITDYLITKSFALMRVKMVVSIFNEIINLKEIARIDRPFLPTFNLWELKNIDISDIEINHPDENACGILIIDSGIMSNHPFLENCVGGEENFQDMESGLQDFAGHGSAVAGCAAYGDIEESIGKKFFSPSNWIFSAKVMYSETNSAIVNKKNAVYDSEKLIEHQLKDAVTSFLSNENYHIRIVNISFGNNREIWHKDYMRQLPLAALLDELAYEYPNVIFIVSAGNQHPNNIFDTIADIKDNYPKYLLCEDFRIINPATSALSLTVGSIAPSIRIEEKKFSEEQIKIPIAGENQPSPFTRAGPGINEMVKPEFVDYGGNLILYNNYGRVTEDNGGKLLLINNQVTNNLLKFDYGTSYSAPKIAHLAGEIANKFPQRSANFIKCLLMVGADYPFILQDDFYSSKRTQQDNLNVCGYGIPRLEYAINSFDNRVILFDEGNLQLNKIKVYSLQLPNVFFNEEGKKRIIVTLSFTPQTRSTRGDSYLGNRMEFHLFHQINPQILVERYGIIATTDVEQEVPDDLKKYEINLFPGPNIRKTGCHQKAWKEYKRKPKNRPDSPISLVLVNYNKWMHDETAKIDYCLSVTFEHEREIDLYNQIRTTIQTRIRIV
jgi:hypothetical protein